MKKLIIILIFSLSYLGIDAQNLVNNPSFEDTLYLPANISKTGLEDYIMNCLCDRGTNTYMQYPLIGRPDSCIGWYNVSYGATASTPDYFNQDVDPTHNNSLARFVDVPVNFANTLDYTQNPLVPNIATSAFHGKGYIGLGSERYRKRTDVSEYPWTEIIAQKLDATNSNNYLKEGGRYKVSFRVAKATHPSSTGHSIKRISAFFTDKKYISNSKSGYSATEFEKNNFMVNGHSYPTGYLERNDWELVSGIITARKDLNYLYLGIFDLEMGKNNGGNSLFPDSLVTPDSNASTSKQLMYYYIDSVNVNFIQNENTCDCEDLSQDIKMLATHTTTANVCCQIVHVKVDGQNGFCQLQEMRWRSSYTGDWDTLNILDIEKIRLEDSIYVPIDTICINKSYDGDTIHYDYEFRAFGDDNFGCLNFFDEPVNCAACPCEWVYDPYPDPGDTTKNAVRIEAELKSRNGNNDCCFEIKFINNTPIPIYADRIKLFSQGIANFTNTNTEYEYLPGSVTQTWNVPKNISPYDTITLGEYCIPDSTSLFVNFDLQFSESSSYFSCFGANYKTPIEVSCDACCPGTMLDYEKIKNQDECCIQINGFDDNDCGTFIKYYTIVDSVPIQAFVPFQVCQSNSDLKIRIEIQDENHNVLCNKNFDFSELLLDCNCCDDILVDVKEDKTFVGSGCKFIIDRIKKSGSCSFDSTTVVEYGFVDSTGFHFEGSFDFYDSDMWQYYLTSCQTKTVRFNFKIDDEIICTKEVDLVCQDCGDIDFGYEELNGEDIVGCCLRIIYGDAPSGGCEYYGKMVYLEKDLPKKIDISNDIYFDIETEYDTITICSEMDLGPLGDTYYDIYATIGIYSSNGDLMCSFVARRDCNSNSGGSTAKKANGYTNVDFKNILVDNNLLTLPIEKTNYLNYKIYNISGQLISDMENLNFNNELLEINVQNLETGIYSITIETDENSFVRIFNIVR